MSDQDQPHGANDPHAGDGAAERPQERGAFGAPPGGSTGAGAAGGGGGGGTPPPVSPMQGMPSVPTQPVGSGQPGSGQPGSGQPGGWGGSGTASSSAPGAPGAPSAPGSPGGPGSGGWQGGSPAAQVQSQVQNVAGDSGNFFKALFDFSFTNFVTPMLVRFVYLLATLALGAAWLVWLITGFAQNVGFGLVVLVLGPIVLVIYLALIRMTLEFYLSVVRMSEDIHKRLPQA